MITDAAEDCEERAAADGETLGEDVRSTGTGVTTGGNDGAAEGTGSVGAHATTISAAATAAILNIRTLPFLAVSGS